MARKNVPAIRLRGVRQNNLKNVDVDLPLGHLTVVTGLSGAGKSSLVFDALHAEGNRRYAETFSSYTRQFLELLDRPKVETIDNIRPSIAIEQGNSVKTSRSTVGTMTELTDYFKVWFSHVAALHDPETGEVITLDTPQSIWRKARTILRDKTVLMTFNVQRAGKLDWTTILSSLSGQGYTRAILENTVARLDELQTGELPANAVLQIVQDRITLGSSSRARFIEAATAALHFGKGTLSLHDAAGRRLQTFSEGLHRPGSQRRFQPASPNLFSFNSPIGACPSCRGFGRVIEIDDNLIIPDHSLTLREGAIKAFSGAVYSESQRDLLRACKRKRIPTATPWKDLSAPHREFVLEGDPDYTEGGGSPRLWYGVRRFFGWLESNTYKMHVRVFLSRYRSYVACPDCGGARLQKESLCWQWQGHTLPDLYRMPVSRLLEVMRGSSGGSGEPQAELALDAIRTRLGYLEAVGLGYLTLDRASRTLSGGETQRVNLTSCLGTSLVDTLFILDEPSVGLHPRDIDRLIQTLRQLVALGNTVVVVEHDEAIMRAADTIIEVGPLPGKGGGEVVYCGPPSGIKRLKGSPTGQFLAGKRRLMPPEKPRPVTQKGDWLRLRGVTCHNLNNLDVDLPLQRFVALSGVSGSGKSTLLYNALYQGLLARSGKAVEHPARILDLSCDSGFGEILLVDQSPVSRTPRSNPALFVGVWDAIRQRFARSDEARQRSLTASAFSFNSGDGRCPQCQGLGSERVEMQFMADVFVPCPLCEGKQFKEEILEVRSDGLSIADVLRCTIEEALEVFADDRKIASRLDGLVDVGLGYLPLGQPLNTLSGGESQRLKLVRFAGAMGSQQHPSLLLLDEPTTGLHKADIERLLKVLQSLVDAGHSLIVIEHQMDVIRAADWVLELGPEAGDDGGRLLFSGTPADLSRTGSATARYLTGNGVPPKTKRTRRKQIPGSQNLVVRGAREHNLKNIDISLPRGATTVITGVSGSGKSTLAFDIIFAEGQRRFMESMSSWARKYVEQLPKPDIDALEGISPSVAIEQRVTHGTRKSTVATITEVAQYLRLLYARIGEQHSPSTGERLVALDPDALLGHFRRFLTLPRKGRASQEQHLFVPLVRDRKGHHEPIAKWALDHGFAALRINGCWTPLTSFKKLDRYREHTIDLDFATIRQTAGKLTSILSGRESVTHEKGINDATLKDLMQKALHLGKGRFYLDTRDGANALWLSTAHCDPVTGEAFPQLDPKDFSWNSPRGWCPSCHGYGHLFDWMAEDERFTHLPTAWVDGAACEACGGQRLNKVSRAVYLRSRNGVARNLPELLSLTAPEVLAFLETVETDIRGQAILAELLPEIRERLTFMDRVGLEYLNLDRSTSTLSGGEAQRIRLAAQLGSNLAGALYVLDEPSIGLHECDNERLLRSLDALKAKGNTLVVVEHDPLTMKRADHLIDLGPGAGKHGGEVLAAGPWKSVARNPKSLTAKHLKEPIPHPLRGTYRDLPRPWNPRSKNARKDWIHLKQASLRNLKGDDLLLPKGRLVVVCGVSGAGKSTLIRDVLLPAVRTSLKDEADPLSGNPRKDGFQRLRGGSGFRKVIEVDQSPIGKTPRSTPATYIGAFDLIRDRFTQIPEARVRGYTRSTFSFNTKGGRCETCKGAGRLRLEMNFLPDTYIPCDACKGRRYGPELDDIRWRDASIADVLEMTFEEAARFFAFDARLHPILDLMVETGLGYLTLGQSSPTLSGGEAQRLKLVSELTSGLPSLKETSNNAFQPNLYLLEEPTIGLHLHDCERLLHLLHRLVDLGHSVIVIEHHLDLIADADYVVEVGPKGGDDGGQILYQGPLAGLYRCKHSPTRPFLP